MTLARSSIVPSSDSGSREHHLVYSFEGVQQIIQLVDVVVVGRDGTRFLYGYYHDEEAEYRECIGDKKDDCHSPEEPNRSGPEKQPGLAEHRDFPHHSNKSDQSDRPQQRQKS
eukprot:CAMPEP_0206532990 /NCGR_PEP_ID=MMETSP0325_2-20121206/4700_1 /ASSEMBLY_ACC=CAM_ASM_000347 /TAXON_ID=2866 /ORGANISM="Crypthecodinium cohnii, Strain Seligo" /LENGTH=112 /DNA_ID=CAMNT_0054029551 /DNA_START=477 /DNA_END=816 /DNA_ORIENTATION=-